MTRPRLRMSRASPPPTSPVGTLNPTRGTRPGRKLPGPGRGLGARGRAQDRPQMAILLADSCQGIIILRSEPTAKYSEKPMAASSSTTANRVSTSSSCSLMVAR